MSPLQPKFTKQDVTEVRQMNRKLDRLPRLRMETALGRVTLNLLLRMVEIYPLLRRRRPDVRIELKTIDMLGKRVKIRIFMPLSSCRGIIVDCHGGGWTIGNARMQYMRDQFSGRVRLSDLDNGRYPGLTWTSVRDHLSTVNGLTS